MRPRCIALTLPLGPYLNTYLVGLIVEESEETHHLLSQVQLDEKVVIVDLDKSTVQSAWEGNDMCPSVLDMLPKRHLEDLRLAIEHKVRKSIAERTV